MGAAFADSMAETNARLIKSGYEAFGRGDLETVSKIFAEDIFWHVPGRGPLSRDYHGRQEVLGFFDRFLGLSHGSFRLEVDDLLATDDKVVVLCTQTAERAGRRWTSPEVHVWTVKDGHAVRFWEFQGDQQAEDEFWAAPE